jgi:hypothetical protein
MSEKTQEKAEKRYEKAKRATPPGEGSRFEALSESLEEKGAEDPKALAAWIGRKKYGKTGFAKLAKK